MFIQTKINPLLEIVYRIYVIEFLNDNLKRLKYFIEPIENFQIIFYTLYRSSISVSVKFLLKPSGISGIIKLE